MMLNFVHPLQSNKKDEQHGLIQFLKSTSQNSPFGNDLNRVENFIAHLDKALQKSNPVKGVLDNKSAKGKAETKVKDNKGDKLAHSEESEETNHAEQEQTKPAHHPCETKPKDCEDKPDTQKELDPTALLENLKTLLSAWLNTDTPLPEQAITEETTDTLALPTVSESLTTTSISNPTLNINDELLNTPLENLSENIKTLADQLKTLNQSDTLVNPDNPQQTQFDLHLEKTVSHLSDVMAKLPPEGQKALKEVVEKLQLLQANTEPMPKMSFGKSPVQLHLEWQLNQEDKRSHQPILADVMATQQTDLKPAFAVFQDQLLHDTVPPLPDFPGLDKAVQLDNIPPLESIRIESPTLNLPKSVANLDKPIAIDSPADQVVSAAKLSINNGKKEMIIHLKPQELGEVKLLLNSNAQNHVSAKLITETPQAKEVLEKSIAELSRSLENNGIKIGKITIVQAGAQTADAQNDTAGQFGQSNQQNLSQNQQQFSQHHNNPSQEAFNTLNASFTDGGSSWSQDETSSQSSFDTDVEGEEVLAGEPSVNLHDGTINIKA